MQERERLQGKESFGIEGRILFEEGLKADFRVCLSYFTGVGVPRPPGNAQDLYPQTGRKQTGKGSQKRFTLWACSHSLSYTNLKVSPISFNASPRYTQHKHTTAAPSRRQQRQQQELLTAGCI